MPAALPNVPVEVLAMFALVPMLLVPVAVSQMLLVRMLLRDRRKQGWDLARQNLVELAHASGWWMMSPLAIRVGGWLWPPTGSRRKR